MHADDQRNPPTRGRLLLAIALMSSAVAMMVATVAPVPGAWHATAFLVLLSVLPGGSLLIITDRRASSPMLTLTAAVAISIALVTAVSLVMAYLEIWIPAIAVLATALLSAAAGIVELRRGLHEGGS